ncbi:MAG: hypothetical protein MJZ98_00985 [Paludibacteraceae bacterium]|nr:hypothetical protein [Paludibacteraceae bacterium]
MKKFFFAALAAVTVLFAACGHEPVGPTPGVDPNAETVELSIYSIAWYGDYYGNGTTNFFVQLLEDDVNYDGAYVMFDLCAASNDIVGTYTANTTAEAGTFVAGDGEQGSNIVELAGGEADGDPEGIVDGTLVVTKSGNTYKFVYTSADGKKVYVAEGAAEISNGAFPGEPMEATNITVNATQAEAVYYGDNGYGGDEYVINLAGNYYAAIDLCAANGSSATAVPAGTYTVAGTGAAGSINPGMYYSGYLIPTIVYSSADGQSVDEAWYVQSGSLTIAEANGTYTISGTVVSGFGSQITINYSGAIACEDGSQQAPRMAMRRNVVVKGRK